MNHLIIYAHPNPSSFNHAILEKTIAASVPNKVVVRDLYQLNFKPILDWRNFKAHSVNTMKQMWQLSINIGLKLM